MNMLDSFVGKRSVMYWWLSWLSLSSWSSFSCLWEMKNFGNYQHKRSWLKKNHFRKQCKLFEKYMWYNSHCMKGMKDWECCNKSHWDRFHTKSQLDKSHWYKLYRLLQKCMLCNLYCKNYSQKWSYCNT